MNQELLPGLSGGCRCLGTWVSFHCLPMPSYRSGLEVELPNLNQCVHRMPIDKWKLYLLCQATASHEKLFFKCFDIWDAKDMETRNLHFFIFVTPNV